MVTNLLDTVDRAGGFVNDVVGASGAADIRRAQVGQGNHRVAARFESSALDNPSAADNLVTIVEYRRLAGSDSALGSSKGGNTSSAPAGSSVAQAGSWRWRILIFTRIGPSSGDRNPVQAAGAQVRRGQFLVSADGNAMAGRIDLQT